MKTFTPNNITDLRHTCKKIINLCNEVPNGDFMTIQLICLGDNIKEFINNPIVKYSGIKPESASEAVEKDYQEAREKPIIQKG